MSTWDSIGGWLKDNGTGLLKVAGAVVTGNVPAGIAAVASMVSEATGETNPNKALASLQNNPELMVKLEEIIKRNEQSIREHHREVLKMELEDDQKAHEQQQLTIRNGDNANDEYVRRTRPWAARLSLYATVGYTSVVEFCYGMGWFTAGASWEILTVLSAPIVAYMGARTFDKLKSK